MANLILGEHGKMLEYRHLIANMATKKTWTYSYGNKLGQLTQGMPGQNNGTKTICFIPKTQVPQE
jgi:hypothetical protein